MEEFPLEARGVSKRYAECAALSRVDLVARAGGVHGLLGANGAGKTTLMRVLLGLVRRDAGTVQVLGRRLATAGGPVPEGVAGFVEASAFYPYLSGRRNLDLLARLDDLSEVRVTADQALDQVGLRARADLAVSGYSAGMRQRLGLAAALIRSPRLLLLDEPTSSLDPAGAREVRALMQRLADGGAAVVLSSHDMSEVEQLCATLTILDRGRVVFSGTVEELRRLAPGPVHLLRTSDDQAALALTRPPGVTVAVAGDSGLEVSAGVEDLDRYVVALGRAGIAVRGLERRAHSLEFLFLQLTGQGAAGESPAAARPDAPGGPGSSVVR